MSETINTTVKSFEQRCDEVLASLKANEITASIADTMLRIIADEAAAAKAVAESRKSAAKDPLTRKDGTIVDSTPYTFRLCRRKDGKTVDQVWIPIVAGKATKGQGFAGGITFALPCLEVMAKDGWKTAQAALTAYADGSICYSSTKPAATGSVQSDVTNSTTPAAPELTA